MNQAALGKRIKTAREKKNMTQEDLAAAVDYSVDHMSVIERGVKAPKLDKLVSIANVLGVGTDELLQDDLTSGVLLQASEISDKLKTLSPEKQRIALWSLSFSEYSWKSANYSAASFFCAFFRHKTTQRICYSRSIRTEAALITM